MQEQRNNVHFYVNFNAINFNINIDAVNLSYLFNDNVYLRNDSFRKSDILGSEKGLICSKIFRKRFRKL